MKAPQRAATAASPRLASFDRLEPPTMLARPRREPAQRRRGPGRTPARGPHLERLEDRALLAAPSGLEQELLEWINRARTDPAGEYRRLVASENPAASPIPGVANALTFFGVDLARLRSELAGMTPAPPLAWSSPLHDAARGHNRQMIAFDRQEHQLPGEPGLGDRIRAAGYEWLSVGENIFAYADSVAQAHAAFVIDWGLGPGGMQAGRGHRANLLNPAFVEAGIAVTPEGDPATRVGPLVITQDFGYRGLSNPFLLGVVFNDGNGNAFYDAGEGLGGVQVTATGLAGTFRATASASGGYQLNVPPGDYQVTFSGPGLPGAIVRDVTVGAENEKLDLDARAALPTVSVRMADALASVVEGKSIELTLIRAGDLSGETVVRVAFGPGGTVGSGDVAPLTSDGLVRFAPGQTRQTIRVQTIEDTRVEPTESVVLVVYPVSAGVAIAAPTRTSVLISDDDGPPSTPPRLAGVKAGPSNNGLASVIVRLRGDVAAPNVLRRTAYVLRRAGADGRLGTRDDAVLTPIRVRYDRATHKVTLLFRANWRHREALQLSLRASLLRSNSGRGLQGSPTRRFHAR
jgi:hypothetical protein